MGLSYSCQIFNTARQTLEAEIKDKKQEQAVLLVNKRELEQEMAQLVKAKTEVACLVDDLRTNESQSVNQRSSLDSQLRKVLKSIQEKEVELMELEPEWDAARKKELHERQTWVMTQYNAFKDDTDSST